MKRGKPLWYITVNDKKATAKSEKYELVGEPTIKVEKELKEKALDYYKLKNNTDGFVYSSIFVGYTRSIKELPKIEIQDKKDDTPNVRFTNNKHKFIKKSNIRKFRPKPKS